MGAHVAQLLQVLEAWRVLRIERVCRVRLELDRVGASGDGSIDQALGERQVAVVVRPGLRHHEAGLSSSQPATANLNALGHATALIRLTIARATRLAPRPST